VTAFRDDVVSDYDNDHYDGNAFGGDDDDDHENDGPGFSLVDDATQNEIGLLERGIRKVEKIRVGHATVAKKVDVRRLKKDLWDEIEGTLLLHPSKQQQGHDEIMTVEASDEAGSPKEHGDHTKKPADQEPTISFQQTVREMEAAKAQPDVTLPFYFICVLHLANEKGLELDSLGLEDFMIRSSQQLESSDATPLPQTRRQANTAGAAAVSIGKGG
jgi:condensin complex subunit 2